MSSLYIKKYQKEKRRLKINEVERLREQQKIFASKGEELQEKYIRMIHKNRLAQETRELLMLKYHLERSISKIKETVLELEIQDIEESRPQRIRCKMVFVDKGGVLRCKIYHYCNKAFCKIYPNYQVNGIIGSLRRCIKCRRYRKLIFWFRRRILKKEINYDKISEERNKNYKFLAKFSLYFGMILLGKILLDLFYSGKPQFEDYWVVLLFGALVAIMLSLWNIKLTEK